MADNVFGPYKLDIRYFDAGWNEVKAPGKPGRYGALVTIQTAGGLTDTRHVTLFKSPKKYSERADAYDTQLEFPEAFGLPPEIGKTEAGPIQDQVNSLIRNSEAGPAMLVAGLYDAATNPAMNQGFDLWSVDDEWWTELDRKLGHHEIYKYRVWLPEDYEKEPGKSWPLVLCLHGSGSRGTDLKNVTGDGLPRKMELGAKFPFIVIAPLCPAHEGWYASTVIETLDDAMAKYRVEKKRVYLTGLSMGGFGAWETAARYPERFAAIVPIAGGAFPEIAPRLVKMPIWAFHGDIDPSVPIARDQRIVDALKKLNAPVKFTVYPGVDHDSWTRTYDNPELYDWLLKQSK